MNMLTSLTIQLFLYLSFPNSSQAWLLERRIDVLSKRLGKLESCVNKLYSFLKKGLTLFTASKVLSIDLMTEQFM